jgi:hypothetical protein
VTNAQVVHADPTKDFFISMITRDISLQDCILDLIDNSIDGARAELVRRAREEQRAPSRRLDGFRVDITFDQTHFSIVDNCGGISLDDAVNYAFRFGRRKDAPRTDSSIGMYGIGMKRAIFKIGRQITVDSSAPGDAFRVPVDVGVWANHEKNWDFPLEPLAAFEPRGTNITIREVYPNIADDLNDAAFATALIEIIGRDYALLIQEGFRVSVNGSQVKPLELGFLQSDDFSPYQYSYEDGDVSVEVVAGFSTVPVDDDQPGDAEKPETKFYGWYVTCNDRVVLAGNKDERTVWGDEKFPRWHPQFNGFLGIVHFRSTNPSPLPWTTTKRDVDEGSPLYMRARTHMREATRTFIDYTNMRKERLDKAKALESAAARVAVARPATAGVRISMRVPNLEVARISMATISYRVPTADFDAVSRALNAGWLSRAQVGLRTFEFFKIRMVAGQ